MHPIIERIETIATKLQLDIQNKDENSISLWTSSYLGIHLLVRLDENNMIQFYYFQRTSSWEYAGERTDLHDVIPLLFAAFLRRFNLCSSELIDICNPATGSDVEIYARYIVPIQVNHKL